MTFRRAVITLTIIDLSRRKFHGCFYWTVYMHNVVNNIFIKAASLNKLKHRNSMKRIRAENGHYVRQAATLVNEQKN